MLSFKKKREIQKQIKAEYENLEGVGDFKSKRAIQKQIKELYAKLGAGVTGGSDSQQADQPSGDDLKRIDLISDLQHIEEVLEDPNATKEDYLALSGRIDRVEENEAIVENEDSYKRVIALLKKLTDGTTHDSLFDGLSEDNISSADFANIEKFVSRRIPSKYSRDIKIRLKGQEKAAIEADVDLSDHEIDGFTIAFQNAVKRAGGHLGEPTKTSSGVEWEVTLDSAGRPRISNFQGLETLGQKDRS